MLSMIQAKPRLSPELLHVGNPCEAVTFDQVRYTAVDADAKRIEANSKCGKVAHYQLSMSVRPGMEVNF